MFEKGISQSTRRSLALLTKSKILDKFYLAGGTACSLQLGHRLSLDLDFFTQKNFDTAKLASKIKKIGNFTTTTVTSDTLLGTFNGTKISFFPHPYPLIDKVSIFENVALASLADIAAMKINAITGRGLRRDFIDLYFIARKYPLGKILKFYDRKYKLLKDNKFHIVKSLVYFADAEDDQMPQMIEEIDWEDIKKFFEGEVKKISKKLVYP